MKNLKNLYLLLAVLGLSQVVKSQACNPGTTPWTSILTIVNNRYCPVTVNWEVSDCIVNNYCNSRSQTGLANLTGTIIIAARSTYTVDIPAQNSGSGIQDCSWYSPVFPTDVEVYLFEIDGNNNGGTFYGGVSNGCAGCFSTGIFASGTSSPGSCTPAAWSMQWTNPLPGVTVNIN